MIINRIRYFINKYFASTSLMFYTLITSLFFFKEIIDTIKFLLNRSNVDKMFILSFDFINQHVIFCNEYFRLIDSGNIFSWSWNTFLGTNFFASKGYYLVGDIYTYITYFCNKLVGNLEASMFFILLLKLIISAWGFNLLLKKLNTKNWVTLLFGVLYCFSGWQAIFAEHTMYASFYSILPFLFLGAEYILQDRKYFIFTIGAILLLCINYYLMWPACILLLVYWILRYIIIFDSFIFKDFLCLSLKTLGVFILCVMASAIVWYPSLLHILDTTRFGTSLYTYDTWPHETKLALITNLLTPIIRYNDPIFNQGWYYFNQIGLYCGTLVLVLLPSLFTSQLKKKEKVLFTIWIILSFMLLISPKVGLVLHFTYSLRYTFLISFSMLFITSQILSNTKKFKLIPIISAFAFVCGLYYVIVYLFVPNYYGYQGLEFIELKVLNWSLILSACYCILLILWGRFKYQYLLIFCLILINIIDVYNIGLIALKSNKHPSPQYTFVYGDTFNEFEAALDNINTYDKSFFRVFTTFGDFNELMYKGNIKSLKTYDSVYQYSLRDFLDIFEMYPDTNWIFDFSVKEYFDALTVKYYVIWNQEQYIYEWFLDGERIDELSTDNISVFKTKYEPYIVKSYSQIDTVENLLHSISTNDYYMTDISQMLKDTLYVENDSLLLNKKSTEDIEVYANTDIYSNNHLQIDLNLPADSYLYFAIPYDRGWSANINGEPVKLEKVNGGFLGTFANEGNLEISLSYSMYGKKVGLLLSVLGILTLIIIKLISYFKGK